MTALTTRTLRNYIRLDVLSGQKDAGSWRFSEEEVSNFFKNPSVRKSIQAKPIRFAFSYEKHTAQVMFQGPQETLLPILAAYEAQFSK